MLWVYSLGFGGSIAGMFASFEESSRFLGAAREPLEAEISSTWTTGSCDNTCHAYYTNVHNMNIN